MPFVAWLEVWPEYGPDLVAFRGIGFEPFVACGHEYVCFVSVFRLNMFGLCGAHSSTAFRGVRVFFFFHWWHTYLDCVLCTHI